MIKLWCQIICLTGVVQTYAVFIFRTKHLLTSWTIEYREVFGLFKTPVLVDAEVTVLWYAT